MLVQVREIERCLFKCRHRGALLRERLYRRLNTSWKSRLLPRILPRGKSARPPRGVGDEVTRQYDRSFLGRFFFISRLQVGHFPVWSDETRAPMSD